MEVKVLDATHVYHITTSETGVLPVRIRFHGSDSSTRTSNRFITNELLYQLSYVGILSRKLRESNPQALAEPRISSPLESPISCASIAEAAGLEPT